MTINFVSKVSRIKNKKDKEYYVYRINIPSDVTKGLDLKHVDHIFIKAKKAEWYHMLDWSTMTKTWDRLPPNIKKNIIEDGLMQSISPNSILEEKEEAETKVVISSGIPQTQFNIGSG